jgi:predicted PurR-regulated permease PerM
MSPVIPTQKFKKLMSPREEGVHIPWFFYPAIDGEYCKKKDHRLPSDIPGSTFYERSDNNTVQFSRNAGGMPEGVDNRRTFIGYLRKIKTGIQVSGVAMNPAQSLSKVSPMSGIMITLAAAVVLFAGIQAASSILGPLLLSVYLTLIFGTLLHWFERKGLSTRPALILTLFIFFGTIAVFIFMIAGSFIQAMSDLPGYLEKLEGSLEAASPFLVSIGIDPATLTFQNLIQFFSAEIHGLVSNLWGIASPLVLVFLTTLFLLFEAKGFSRKLLIIIHEHRPNDLDRFTDLAQKNVDYLVIRTGVNLAMGVGTTVILTLIGVKYAIFWGFFAFLLGFIPNIGFWIAVVPPMLLAWFDLGPVSALLVLAGSGLMDFLAEYLIFPLFTARGLELSTAVVFISLFFWGWILGGIGVLLAVPLTLCVQMVCELSDETRWIGFLIGTPPDVISEKP